MKIGCGVHTLKNCAPYEDTIHHIGELGFESVELISFSLDELRSYYTPAICRELQQMASDYNMEISQFILSASLTEGLQSRDRVEQEKAYDIFEHGLEVASRLGTNIINIVSNWPNELHAPIDYLPHYIHPFMRGVTEYSPKLTMELPPHFDANGLWNRYMDALQVLVEKTRKAGMRFSLEGHANVIVGTTDAFLRAFDCIPDTCFGANFDVCWQFMQREYPPWSIYKLADRIFHVHVRDADGLMCYQLPPGQGIIDWNATIRALIETGYDGVLSLEIGGYQNPDPYLKQSIAYLKAVLQQELIKSNGKMPIDG